MTSYAVIGASRGIGLEFVRQLANRPNTTVFAVVRNTRTSAHLASAVQYSNNVHVVEADVSDYGSLKHAAKQVSEITSGTLDCLIHNAALMDYKATYKGYGDYADMEELDAEFITAYKVNTLGVIHGISAFLPLLRASSASPKKIVVISSAGADHKFVNLLGMADTTAYGITKAAAVVATSKWAVQLKDEGFVVVSLLPGLVDTSGTVGEHGQY
ncbi:NAD-P-binding protein [Fomes fomentarius]|nr:NAD-P-binding protein [Fomes fomentarius]